MSDDLLAYHLLKAANLITWDEQLVKATITELNYEIVKSKLTIVFSDESELTPSDEKSNKNKSSNKIRTHLPHLKQIWWNTLHPNLSWPL